MTKTPETNRLLIVTIFRLLAVDLRHVVIYVNLYKLNLSLVISLKLNSLIQTTITTK